MSSEERHSTTRFQESSTETERPLTFHKSVDPTCYIEFSLQELQEISDLYQDAFDKDSSAEDRINNAIAELKSKTTATKGKK